MNIFLIGILIILLIIIIFLFLSAVRHENKKLIFYLFLSFLSLYLFLIAYLYITIKVKDIYKNISINKQSYLLKQASINYEKNEILRTGKSVCNILNLSEDPMKVGYIIRESYRISKKLGIDPLVVNSVIITESSYKTNIVGKFGEIGLMQIKLSTARLFNSELTKEDLLDWKTNLYYGCLYLKDQIDTYGYLKGILAYNGGGGILKYKTFSGKYINYVYFSKVKNNYTIISEIN